MIKNNCNKKGTSSLRIKLYSETEEQKRELNRSKHRLFWDEKTQNHKYIQFH